MIVLVWSLVSSVVELARRRRLAAFLHDFIQQNNDKNMLVCKRNGASTSLEPSPSSGKLTRFVSEPYLHTHRIVYRNERTEVFIESAGTMSASEWRFVPSVISEIQEGSPNIYFVAIPGRQDAADRPSELPQCTVMLDSACDRVAWHKLQPASLYSCPVDRFVDVVYAFSEGCLYENNSSALVETIHTVAAPGSPESRPPHASCSLNGSSTALAQRPLPLLEQLFWGDGFSLETVRDRFASENALHIGHFGSLPRRLANSPRRRYRSCNQTARSARERNTLSFCGDIGAQAARFFDPANQLPPFLRYLDNERRLSLMSNPKLADGAMSSRSMASGGMSPSITIDELDKQDADARSDDDIAEIPYVDDSDVTTSPVPVMETSSYAALLTRKHNGFCEIDSPKANGDVPSILEITGGIQKLGDDHPKSNGNGQARRAELIQRIENSEGDRDPIRTDDVTVKTNFAENDESAEIQNIQTTVGNGNEPRSVKELQKNNGRREQVTEIQDQEVSNPISTSGIVKPKTSNGTRRQTQPEIRIECDEKRCRHTNGNGQVGRALPPLPRTSSSSNTRREEAQAIIEQAAAISKRRHSAVVPTLAETFAEYSSRHRSLSPLAQDEFYRRRSLRGSRILDAASAVERESIRRPYTPTRRFLSARNSSSVRAMIKPPSILVYTGTQGALYSRIRENLDRVIPSDLYTVFNISADALKKQPWIEPTTACLVIADTHDLDDAAWTKMQSYFNQSGKIIFVCQNRLLTSLTNTDSSKEQADILRMAFGSRGTVAMGKEFEQFLKKSLKAATKHGVVNETFHSKDLVGGLSYSVVLSKTKDQPMFLYMENSAHQASAVFSDATSDQLLAPGSRILQESLSRVGVAITEHEPPAMTRGLMVAQEESLITEMQGVRYGEEIGLSPKLFFRMAEKAVEVPLPEASRTLLPIQVGMGLSPPADYPFDFARYFARLHTRSLGRVVVHVPVATTTMDVAASLRDAIPTSTDTVVIAGQQVKGVGRAGNEYVSPPGAAMFTFSLAVPRRSLLGQNLCFLQHIFAVALCDAVHELSGMDNYEFPLRIKWPNDFYFNRSHKLGGMLVTCNTRDDHLLVTIGAGLNVSNSRPTVCLNDIVPDGSDLRFTVEDVIAETLNKFQYWVTTYEMKANGQTLLKDQYYKFWLHGQEEVVLGDSGKKVVVRGVNDDGFLLVYSKESPSKLFTVDSNGNTFDMMKGLIRQKTC